MLRYKSFHIYYIRITSIPYSRIGSTAVSLSAAQFKYKKLMTEDSQEDSSHADTGRFF